MRRNFIYFILIFGLLHSCGEDYPEEQNPEPYFPPELFHVFNVVIADHPIVVIGSKELKMGSAFLSTHLGEMLDFTPLQGKWPMVMKDQFGREWNIFGKSENGETLQKITSSFGYWFAWSSIFPGIEIYGEQIISPPVSTKGTAEWDVPEKYVFKGANFDVFESLLYPEFIEFDVRSEIKNGFYLSDEDPVIVVQSGQNIKVYPHKILYYHEIVNDSLNGEQIAVIFSPFTATSTIWNRNIDGRIETFGSSGMIYNNNILPFDRNSESLWSQLLGKCVNGFKKGSRPEIISYFETNWATVKSLYETPLVLSMEIQSEQEYNYQEFPFGDYRTNHEFLYSPNLLYDDTRLQRKEIVFGVSYRDDALLFRLEDFE